ncbi:MAG: hypothetical protein ACYC6Y_16660, partial [Thermoguttaceae bacterium]
PQPHFHKPELVVATNVPAPVPVGVVLPPEQLQDEELKMTLELPAGLEILGGHIGSAALDKVEKGSDGSRRYRLETRVKGSSKTLGRLYLQATGWKDGQEGELRYQFGCGDWESPLQGIPVRAVEVPPAPRLKRILAGLGWWSAADTAQWPDALSAWEQLGLNSFPVFGNWMQADDPLWKLAGEARDRDMFLVNIDSPLHRMVERRKKEAEIYCQFADGSRGNQLCPSYRGQFYQEEVQRFAQMMGRAKADFTSVDIELWGWRGPVDSRKCTRCQADYKASGLQSWEAWQVAQGDEIWKDLVSAARKAVAEAGGPRFEMGGYDFRPGTAYQYTWSVDHLYPEWMQDSQVSTYSCLYPYQLELIGNEVREDRKLLGHSDVLPWLTPGDAGTFPGETLQWALLECYTNGARGVYFWSGRVWDSESLIAYNRVIRAIGPVEDLIVEGELAGEAVSVDKPARVSGIRHEGEMLLLVADYFGRTGGQVKLRISVSGESTIGDLLTGQRVAVKIPAGESAVTIDLGGARAKLLHVKPVQ